MLEVVILLTTTGRVRSPARPTEELWGALDILARHVRRAVAVRRATSRTDPRYRRAGEELTRLSALYRRMQCRMEIPREVWELDAADRPGADAATRGPRAGDAPPETA